jgi:hypothetical protein
MLPPSQRAPWCGSVSTLQVAAGLGMPVDQNTFNIAAGLDGAQCVSVLRWLRERGCAWGKDTCIAAAENGNLCALEWLINAGCPVAEDFAAYAAKRGHMSVVLWRIANL